MESEENKQKIKESITIRGICASIQSMHLPTLDNVLDLFKRAGITLKVIDKK